MYFRKFSNDYKKGNYLYKVTLSRLEICRKGLNVLLQKNNGKKYNYNAKPISFHSSPFCFSIVRAFHYFLFSHCFTQNKIADIRNFFHLSLSEFFNTL